MIALLQGKKKSQKEKKERMRRKIRTVAKMQRMFKTMRQQNESVLKIGGVGPRSRLMIGNSISGREIKLPLFRPHSCVLFFSHRVSSLREMGTKKKIARLSTQMRGVRTIRKCEWFSNVFQRCFCVQVYTLCAFWCNPICFWNESNDVFFHATIIAHCALQSVFLFVCGCVQVVAGCTETYFSWFQVYSR